jgi:hypothetical protein
MTLEYMSITKAMKILDLSRARIYQLISDDRLNRFYVAGHRRGMVPRLLADDVYAYDEQRKQKQIAQTLVDIGLVNIQNVRANCGIHDAEP